MWKSVEVSALVDGRLFGPQDNSFDNCVVDSRQASAGSLFFAIPGQRLDGHAFIRHAWEAGATIVVASVEGYKNHFCAQISPLTDKDIYFTVPPEKTLILVPDALAALQKLAYIWLDELDALVVAVTGSNGKTTTKDMIAAVLSVGFQVHKTPENFNTEIGLPLSVLQAPPGTEVFVLEMGMRGPGQITQLCQICRPDIGVVTNIGNTHIELLGSQEAISQAKWELIASLPKVGMAILNADDAESAAMTKLRGMNCHKVCFGMEGRYEDLQVRAYDVEVSGETGTRFKVACELVERSVIPRRACDRNPVVDAGIQKTDWNIDRRQSPNKDRRRLSHEPLEPIVVELPLPGNHNVLNALAALAVGRALNVPLREGARALNSPGLSKMRLEIVSGIGGSTLINDAYNANPASMKASLGVLKERADGATIAVLGDMFELGQLALSQHLVVGALVAFLGIDYLVTLGSLAEQIARGAVESGFSADRVFQCQSHEEAVRRTQELIHQAGPGCWVLVKASRGMAMERIVNLIVDNSLGVRD
ncbi:MAG: UDP-N-acetylmuramoyl-tripeptide--D-alanyl-D-alanine ligase [Peptococcaceae bacterium]|nr:UDP-N-acetylmuramoyl-tripeptide--D-alanyl-D-alanine ligase [Peptococcaceae bacterium]